MKKSEFIFSLAFKLAAALFSVYGIIVNYNGIISFTYFTILSNIFADVMLILSLIADIKIYKGKAAGKSNSLYFAKYLSVLSIVLTFLVYMLILAPTNKAGILASYFNKGWSSFCLHFVLPVMSAADFFIFDRGFETKRKYALLATIPPLSYVVFVVVLGQLGVRWGNMSAPYNFMNYSAPAGWFGFAPETASSETLGIGVAYMIIILCGIFIALGLLALRLIDLRKKR